MGHDREQEDRQCECSQKKLQNALLGVMFYEVDIPTFNLAVNKTERHFWGQQRREQFIFPILSVRNVDVPGRQKSRHARDKLD